jgi:hypothetical protein
MSRRAPCTAPRKPDAGNDGPDPPPAVMPRGPGAGTGTRLISLSRAHNHW